MPPVVFDPPLIPTPAGPDRLGVVLFDLPGDRFPALTTQLRRLGRAGFTFRWLPESDEAAGRVLVRVEGPPPVVVWRAADGSSSRVYVEQAPGVWVQLGYRLARAEQVPADAGRLFLVRAPGEVEEVPAGEFAGELDTLPLAAAGGAEAAGTPGPAVPVRLRLIPGPARDAPVLWVLREDALAQLTAYCRAAHQQLLGRFTVAASAAAGVPCVVLRAVTTRGPGPVFVGPAVGYRPLPGLPGLFVPVGTRLVPALRRDALRQAFALPADRVAWLHPLGDGGFRAESLPDAAFRPLTDWVEYKPADPPRVRTGWVQSHRWELDPFVERADPGPRPAPAAGPVRPAPARPRRGLLARTIGWLRRRPPRSHREEVEVPDPAVPVEEAVRRALAADDRLRLARPEAVSRAAERCQALEARFLNQLPAVGPDGQAEAWAELAAAYDAVGNHPDAALCWLNALWGQPQPSPLWAWGWLRAEARAARPEVRAIDPGPWLAAPPGPGTTRAMAAWVVWAAAQSPPPPALRARAADLQARLEAHEHWLPVRAAWLARTAVARRFGGDALGLARTRDRLADRLRAGLSLERDTPSFLRFAGEGVRERFQEARRWLADRRDLVHQWLARLPEDARVRPAADPGPDPLRRVGLEPDVAHTRAYADLILAWGLTRFAEHTAAEAVRRQGVAALPAEDPVHAVLRDGFEYRIAQVREGKPPRGPLPADLRGRIGALEGIPRYAVDKLREHSRVLEPTARVDGFREAIFRRAEGGPVGTVDALPADRLDEEAERLLTAEAAREGRPYLAGVVGAVLDRADELTEAGVGPALAALPAALFLIRGDPVRTGRLVVAGLAAAARFDRADVAGELVGRFLRVMEERSRWDVAEAVTGPAARALRRLGLAADADRLLHQVATQVLRGKDLARLRAARTGDWPAGLRVLLHAAGGWYAAGKDDQAHAVLDAARQDLFAPDTHPRERTELALAYAAALGQAPVRIALGRLEELFQRLRRVSVEGTFNSYYSLQPLMIVETAVRAVVSDDFTLGPRVRTWLDADELAVRRRIRDELKEVLAGQGL